MIKRIIAMIFGRREKKENIRMYNIEVKDYKRLDYTKLDLM